MSRKKHTPFSYDQRWLPLPHLPDIIAPLETGAKPPVPQGAIYLKSKVREGKRSIRHGNRGRFYLRFRISPADITLKSITYEIPLETRSKETAMKRAAFVIRTLLRMGKRVLGNMAEFRQAIAESKICCVYGNREYSERFIRRK